MEKKQSSNTIDLLSTPSNIVDDVPYVKTNLIDSVFLKDVDRKSVIKQKKFLITIYLILGFIGFFGSILVGRYIPFLTNQYASTNDVEMPSEFLDQIYAPTNSFLIEEKDKIMLSSDDIASFQEPFTSNTETSLPCFFLSERICSPEVIFEDQEKIFFRGIKANAEYPGVEAYRWGRILSNNRGGLASFYLSTEQTNDFFITGYTQTLHSIERAAIRSNINPGLLYVLIDAVYISANENGYYMGEKSLQTVVDSFRLSEDMQKYLVQNLDLPNNEISQQLEFANLSLSGKKMMYILLTHFKKDVVLDISKEGAWLEQMYLNTFSIQDMNASYTLNFTNLAINPNEYFLHKQSFDFSVCREDSLYVCKTINEKLDCFSADFFDSICLQVYKGG